jgi:hypothetical protein
MVVVPLELYPVSLFTAQITPTNQIITTVSEYVSLRYKSQHLYEV